VNFNELTQIALNYLTYLWIIWLICCTPFLVGAQELTKLLEEVNQVSDSPQKAQMLYQIGLNYQSQEAYPKAISYFVQAYPLATATLKIQVLQQTAHTYMILKDYPPAIEAYQSLLQQTNPNTQDRLLTINQLAKAYQANEQYPEAMLYNEQIIELSRKAKQTEYLSMAYNNLGFLYRQSGNLPKSLELLSLAVETNKAAENQSTTPIGRINALHNLGVTYTQLKDVKQAQAIFQNALDLATTTNNLTESANSYNYLGATHYINRKNNQAIEALEKAVAFGERAQSYQTLHTSYRLLAELYAEEGEPTQAQRYHKLQQDLEAKIAKEEQIRQQKILEKQLAIEKRENELKALSLERERQNALLKQSEIDREKQEQEIALKNNELNMLKQQQALQAADLRNRQLEKERTEQLLQLIRQKAEADQLRKDQELLKLEQKRKESEAKREKSEAEREKQALKLKQKDQALKQETELRGYFGLILGLSTAIVFLAVIAYFLNNRKNKKLSEQNQALQQKQEEVLAQQSLIEEQNKKLSERDHKITGSINAALSIQNAILPTKNTLNTLLKEYFVLYEPRDIVSGDFFWLNQVDGQTIIAALDCTGHGVQGAFMSLIGSSLLDKVVLERKVLNPADILTQLHFEVIRQLSQIETSNDNGMDAAIVVMKPLATGQVEITFSGAKNGMLYIIANQPLQILHGDRKSVGGLQNEKKTFNNQQLVLPKGSVIYLGSDGYEDQNDKKRKKFGSKKLFLLLEQISALPLLEQRRILAARLEAYRAGTEQRDDIMLIGFKL
jgi:serine phosphatase RsbU (regulator of sigma subunit)